MFSGVVSAATNALLPALDFGSWYSPSLVSGLAIFLALSVYAFCRCVAWRGGLEAAFGGD